MKRFRALSVVLSFSLALLPAFGSIAVAQEGPDVTFELRPHCIESDHAAADNVFGGDMPDVEGMIQLAEESARTCPEFTVRDPLSRQTDILRAGDTLDMDIIIHNPSKRPLSRFRAWIAYDSTILEGATVSLSGAFPIATPGEADFSVADNYIKLSGSSDSAVSDTKIVVARIILTINKATDVGTILSFHNANGSATAHTGAFSGAGTAESNVAATVQGSLAIRMHKDGAPETPAALNTEAPLAEAAPTAPSTTTPTTPVSSSATLSSAPTVASSGASSSSAPALAQLFSQLQVHALRVTTEGSSVFLAWNPLPSAELAGYNLYYGSISGRYMQRRSIDKDGKTATIRALPVGQTYYFAVRAVNTAGQESDFSQEVGVAVGNPATSTSPLSGALIDGGPNGHSPDTNGNVAGESGPETWLMLFIVVSAVTGTMLAFRRQWTAISLQER